MPNVRKLLHIEGPAELDLATLDEFAGRLANAVAEHPDLLIVDLTRAEFVSVVGVEVIRDTQRVLADRGGRLRVEHASRQVQHLLSLSGADVELC